MAPAPDPGELSRREFLRRGAMAGVGAAAATAFGVGHRRGSAATRGGIPPLEVAAQVAAVASVPGRAIAVGSRDHQPAVWVHAFGTSSWALSAAGGSFPTGTVLAAAAGVEESFVVVGHTRELSRVDVVIDDRTGRPVQLPVYATIPAIFFSDDGSVWQQVQRAAPGAELGSFGAIGLVEDSQALAIGFRSIEPGVGGPYGLISMDSGDGRRWSPAELSGVVPPRHGSVTFLASTEGSALLATRGIRETGLYRASRGRWHALEPPADRVTYKAAAPIGGELLLTGVDDRAQPRAWTGTGHHWKTVDHLAGLPPGGVVVDLARVGESLVAVAHDESRSLVTEIEV
jgi:hypothetical protein